MRYSGIILTLKNEKFKQVSKVTAKKLFNEGKEVLFLPCNMRFGNIWQSPCGVTKNSNALIGYDGDDAFEYMCSDYMYYNCDRERGKRINYFVKVYEYESM